ncbi:MAG: hypothetical protein DRJ66_06090, partial [Thermoprotei archaeon]
GRGFATRLVKDALEKMRRDGVHVVMISGIRTLYDRAGCAIAGYCYEAVAERDKIKERSFVNVDVELDKGDKVQEYIRIYEGEGVRYIRPLEHFKILLSGSAWHASGIIYERYPYLVKINDSYLAYLVLHIAKNGSGLLVEYAGSRLAILSALSKIMMDHDVGSVRFKIPWWDEEMLVLSRKMGIKVAEMSTAINGTMRLLNVTEFLESIRPYLVERVGERAYELTIEETDNEKYVISYKDEKFVLNNPKELSWLIFGEPEYVNEVYRKFMPTREYRPIRGELADITRRAFPIPSLPYGLYYT